MPLNLLQFQELVQLQPPDVDDSAAQFSGRISAPVINKDLVYYKGTHDCWLLAFIQQSGQIVVWKVPEDNFDFISNINPAPMPITTNIVLLVPKGTPLYADISPYAFMGTENIWRIPTSFFSN